MRHLRLCVMLLALCGFASPVRAQVVKPSATGNIPVMVTILDPPLTATGTHALEFGAITPGTTSVTVLPRATASGEWRITGVKNRKSIAITFTLPASLTGPNGATIPLSFNGNYAGLCEINTSGACEVASFFTWNPVTTPTYTDFPYRYVPGRKVYFYDEYSVYIGGVALPAATQRAGHYTGTIGVTLVVN